MTRRPRTVPTLLRDVRGTTILEFAIIAPVMCMMMMGLSDLAYQVYAREILSGSIQKAARDAAIQGGAQQTAEIDSRVATTMSDIMTTPTASCATNPPAGTFCATRTSYAMFASAGPEPFDDDNGNNLRDATECYQDMNNNGSWDAVAGTGTSGQGGASDVTLYTISVTYARLFPMAALLGWSSNATISAQTLLKNQPYASRTEPAVTTRCT